MAGLLRNSDTGSDERWLSARDLGKNERKSMIKMDKSNMY
jgi:hypothetical protein